MINPDNLKSVQIEAKLKLRQFVLIKNARGNCEEWTKDVSLVGRVDDTGVEEILEGWAACNHCCSTYRTHSKKDKYGQRKNYGLSSIRAHVAECTNKSQNVPHVTSSSQKSKAKFTYNKNKISNKYQTKLKEAELMFIVAGSHSFNSLENNGILELLQLGIEIGSHYGMLDVHDIFYGRKTIREYLLLKFDAYLKSIRQVLDEPIKSHCLAATSDLWTDDFAKRTYLDFTVFWVTEEYELKHSMLRCKYFEEDSKTAVNIWYELKYIFDSFNLSYGDTPITTDAGSNMVAAFKITDEARYPCMAHRCNTVLETAWDETIKRHKDFEIFCNCVKDLRKYIQQTGGIKDKLPKSIKCNSGTRPWRSYFSVHDSINDSFEKLTEILRERNEQHRIFYINTVLLVDIVNLMAQFTLIFDHLEFSKCPTIQNVVPSYYKMASYCTLEKNSQQKQIINTLKSEILNALDDKYWSSITTLHWIATYLDPTFKSLSFVNDKKDLEKRQNEIKKGLNVLAGDLISDDDDDSDRPILTIPLSAVSLASSPKKKHKTDPFADLRQQGATNLSSTRKTLQGIKVELDRELYFYNNMIINSNLEYENNPLLFWKQQRNDLPLLAKLARSIYAIQASSGESERHFSTAGQIVTEQRSLLDSDCVEALVVLKEAYINNLWPKEK
ncbi:unnamed protein product [Rotaria magnacalcarata]|uniref:HAT C-terminal dimerisation domain-containing protein n=1 Tax=Rotaria magnacalcarata TaxID=392030 RepID=A0A816VZJ0_9BILA|nr:unnamed protein product [Rotaria magnacalcarata]CAF2134005.1 unnamed protein product [Rotaria magnacalcarata]CAF4286809.1 unnamed protein product [Rotaria magnacalcarata]